MKKYWIIAFLGLFLTGFTACKKDKCITGNEYRVGKIREIDPFTSINVNLSAVVELVRDTTDTVPYVEFIVENNLEQYIATPVVNGELQISLSACFDQHQDIVIRVHYDSLNTITISGPGDVQSSQIMVQDSINLVNNSTGGIYLTTDIQKMNSQINGTGIITINGQIGTHTMYITSSGSVQTYQSMTQEALVFLTASGNAYIRVRNNLTGILSGSGNVYYKGFPIINVTSTGTGQVINAN